MSFVSLTSDLGNKDGSVAKIKANLLSQNSKLHIIDVSHSINPFDLYEAAYVIKNTFPIFPINSVHVLLVDALDHPIEKGICAYFDNQFFLTNNNGIISLIEPDAQKVEIRELKNESQNRTQVFCKTAVQLIENPQEFTGLGAKCEGKEITGMKPIAKENEIIGYIIYVDNYGNAISNISKSLFEEIGKQRNFEIFVRNYTFIKVVTHYADVVTNFENENKFHGKNMALFNENGYLEFALYKSNHNSVGGASQLLGFRKGEKVRVQFI